MHIHLFSINGIFSNSLYLLNPYLLCQIYIILQSVTFNVSSLSFKLYKWNSKCLSTDFILHLLLTLFFIIGSKQALLF